MVIGILPLFCLVPVYCGLCGSPTHAPFPPRLPLSRDHNCPSVSISGPQHPEWLHTYIHTYIHVHVWGHLVLQADWLLDGGFVAVLGCTSSHTNSVVWCLSPYSHVCKSINASCDIKGELSEVAPVYNILPTTFITFITLLCSILIGKPTKGSHSWL